ncbi:MAG TPA: hypothetical protein VE963_08380 [Reyranella sp.]|nr:hypothetical protein [Reyranella sp.]
MRLKTRLAVLLGLLLVPICASAAVIGGFYYYPQYDYTEFFAATDGRNFQVILAGDPFPGIDPNTAARELLPVLQAAKPRPALTFTYEAAPERPRPWYRLVLIFNSAPDLGSAPVCNGVTRFGQPRPGTFYVYAVYCRNDQPLSEATAWTSATRPTDPSVNQLFRELFMVVFTDAPGYGRHIQGPRNRP